MTSTISPYLKHMAFWISFWLIVSLLWGGINEFQFYLVKNVAIVSYMVSIVYLNWYLLIPKLLTPRRYISYIASSLIIIYAFYNISFTGIELVFRIAFPELQAVNAPNSLFWWPTDFWKIVSGSAPYSLALLSSSVVYFVLSSNEQRTSELSDEKPSVNSESILNGDEHTLILKEGKIIHKLDVRDVLYVQGMKEYVSWHTKERKLVTLHSLAHLESMLKDKGFLRTHRSYIVNTHCVQTIQYNTVKISDKNIPIGRSYKSQVLEYFQSNL